MQRQGCANSATGIEKILEGAGFDDDTLTQDPGWLRDGSENQYFKERCMHTIILALFLSLSLLIINTTLAWPLPDTADLPLAADSSLLQTTQTPIATSAPGGPEAPAPTGPPLPLTLTLLGLCCAFLILIGVVILGFFVRRENRQVIKKE